MIRILPTSAELAEAAALHAAQSLRNLLDDAPSLRLLVATGESQLDFLGRLSAIAAIDWKRVELFHLDEYVGLDSGHPASFAHYIKERLIDKTGIRTYHLLDGSRDPHEMADAMGELVAAAPIDLAFAGIGENGHLAFNDPPADFETVTPYLVVQLDEQCRRQQVGEGWFASLDQVPERAITISVSQLLQAREIISVVPGLRKAHAVRDCVAGELNPLAPASALRLHPNTTIYLDSESASLLPGIPIGSR